MFKMLLELKIKILDKNVIYLEVVFQFLIQKTDNLTKLEVVFTVCDIENGQFDNI